MGSFCLANVEMGLDYDGDSVLLRKCGNGLGL